MTTQTKKTEAFRALHERRTAFIIPNPWDIGMARILEHLGFEALATTSAGYAFSLGQRDGTMARAQVVAHTAALAAATALPISVDLENGFDDAPESVAETIRQAADAGASGGSIEDSTGRSDRPLYEIAHAVDRIRAAADAARRVPSGFVLTARAENFLVGRPDLADTIARLQGYQDAGADVLYAPGLSSGDDIASVLRSVDRPVNVLAGFPGLRLMLDELSALGVRRVSIGGALARTAYGAALRAARDMRHHGTFRFVEDAVSSRELSQMFPSGVRPGSDEGQTGVKRGSDHLTRLFGPARSDSEGI